MSERVGAAVLGLGVGRMHAQAYHQLDTAELVAVCDGQQERLERTILNVEGHA